MDNFQKMKSLPVELKNINRRADESVTLKVDSLREVSSVQFGELDSLRGCVGLLTLSEVPVGNDIEISKEEIDESMLDSDLYDNHKTPSQRLRNVLYLVNKLELGRSPDEMEKRDFYKKEMEKIIQHYKNKLDD